MDTGDNEGVSDGVNEGVNKYYTPEPEEFHVGFKCECRFQERKYKTVPNDNKIISFEDVWQDWFNYTFTGDPGINFAGEHDESYPLLDYYYYKGREFRVKYLDKEDIESLGFPHTPYKMYCWAFEKENVEIEFQEWGKDTFWSGNLSITVWEPEFIRKVPKAKFWGKCKNKSELKKLLKQLGIDGREKS